MLERRMPRVPTPLQNMLYSVFTIMLCLYVGKAINAFFGGLPSSLYGMIVLNFLLHFRLFNAERLKQTVAWIIKNMSVCFVPAGVGIIEHFDIVAQHGLSIIWVIFISTMALITVVGLLVEKFAKEHNDSNNMHKTTPN